MGKSRDHADQHVLLCYAEGCEGRWEAFCLNFDIAVQGVSFESVRDKLTEAVQLYLATVNELPAADRKRLLARRAPISVWLTPIYHLVKAALTRRDDRLRHEFTLPASGVAIA